MAHGKKHRNKKDTKKSMKIMEKERIDREGSKSDSVDYAATSIGDGMSKGYTPLIAPSKKSKGYAESKDRLAVSLNKPKDGKDNKVGTVDIYAKGGNAKFAGSQQADTHEAFQNALNGFGTGRTRRRSGGKGGKKGGGNHRVNIDIA